MFKPSLDLILSFMLQFSQCSCSYALLIISLINHHHECILLNPAPQTANLTHQDLKRCTIRPKPKALLDILHLLHPHHNHRVHNLRPRMHLKQNLQPNPRQLIRQLQNLFLISPNPTPRIANCIRKKRAPTGYKILLSPCALLATTTVPGLNFFTSASKIPIFSTESIPTSAAKNTTSNISHSSVVAALTSSHENCIWSAKPSASDRRLLRASAEASRSMLKIVALGKCARMHSDVSGRGPEPMKAIFRGAVVRGKNGCRTEASRWERSM